MNSKRVSTKKLKNISKSLLSLNSKCRNGYDHLYSEPYGSCGKNYKTSKKRKRKGFFSSKKRNNFVECEPPPKKSSSFFGFARKKSKKNSNSCNRKVFMDARDCNKRDSFHDVCQKQLQSAKQASKIIYNKLRYGYDLKLSFSTVVYSDRYFRYRRTLDTKIMPMKCFVSNDLGAPVLYKKFTKLQNNYQDFFISTDNFSQDDLLSFTRHYLPIFTAWSIQPYSPGIGPLRDFGDASLYYHIDRRFTHRSVFEELQILYETSRRVDANYKPLYDMVARCKEMMDYDEYIYACTRLGDMTHKQLQPLIYLDHKEVNYRLSVEGFTEKRFSEYDIQKCRKQAKKYDIYQLMNCKSECLSKFPVPDFALSDDQLLTRKKGSLYEKIKCEPDKIYDKFAKDAQRISAANLAHADIHQSIKTIDKTYSTHKKVLNTEKRRQSTLDRCSPTKGYYNNGRSSPLLVLDKYSEPKPLPQLPHFDRNNMIVMEPLLLMQTLNEDREKRKHDLSRKNQKIIIRIIITYSTIMYVLSLITFYFFSLS